jgi:hypothetical protein
MRVIEAHKTDGVNEKITIEANEPADGASFAYAVSWPADGYIEGMTLHFQDGPAGSRAPGVSLNVLLAVLVDRLESLAERAALDEYSKDLLGCLQAARELLTVRAATYSEYRRLTAEETAREEALAVEAQAKQEAEAKAIEEERRSSAVAAEDRRFQDAVRVAVEQIMLAKGAGAMGG